MVQFNKLRLHGFKSFVEATELDIGQGLTGIVGPNGCGKSNLVEALRWAMGETSAKRMRGSGMDDVIFNGTSDRAARNSAEVTLYLDNSDRTAPAEINDADDLEVSRKIAREVGSTYKVNGKTVRARDVQLLFADSSIGAHSPAMVSQGRVADMINAKPHQRRLVLEEAAGISGLHARRHEAELKLRAAENNLTRVEDVMGSMSNQLDSLKKQARQASRYRNLSGHIQQAEGTVLYLRWKDSTTAVETAMQAFQQAEEVVREQTVIVTNLTSQQTNETSHIPELRQAEAEAAAVLQRLKLAYGTLENEERQVQEEREKASHLLEQFTSDIEHENLQQQEATETISRLKTENENLMAAGENHHAREEEARILSTESKEEVERIENELSRTTEEVAAAEADRQAGERRIADLERRLENLSARKEKLTSEHEDLIANTPARAELEQVEAELAETEELYQQARDHLEQAEAARAPAEESVSTADESRQGKQRNVSELKAEADALTKLLRTQDTDSFEPVLDQLTVDAGLEKALAVALGDDLQATLDDSAPIFWRNMPETVTPPVLPGNAKPLTQYVKGPAALSYCLSQIGVVDSAEEAAQLANDLKPGQSLVTMTGGAWRWDGLTVQPGAESAAAVRLEQKNRLADLQGLIATAETELAEATQKTDTVREERAQVLETISKARQHLRETEEKYNTLRRRQSSLSSQISEVTAKLSGLASSIENAEQEIEGLTTELAEAKETFAALPDTTEGREKIISIKETLSEKRQILADRQAQYSEISREGEARNRRIEQINSEIETWESRCERINNRITEFKERIEDAKATLERLAERPGQIENEKQSLLSKISEADDLRNQAAEALAKAESEVAEMSRELKEAESLLSDAREARAHAQASVSTAQNTQNNVEEQIQEKFSCTPEEMIAKLELDLERLPEQDDIQRKLERLIRERDNMGPVNLRAEVESQELTEKMTEMETEKADLEEAIDRLRQGIQKLNKEARERLLKAFDTVNSHFQELFTRLFQGGRAYLQMVDADDPLQAGLEIFAQPPGKKLQVLSLLSGGEQTLTSIALIFAMFLTNPAPICVLDEVDAPLDESNVDRMCNLLEDLAKDGRTRFIVVTHHRLTMARMNRLYGVTMSEKGVSQLVSVDLTQKELDLEANVA